MLQVPDKKKKSVNDDVPIFGASSSPSSSTPVVATSDKEGDGDLPIFSGSGTNKKKDGSENYGTGSPSESVSDVESTEQIAPKSFIENDIENSQYSRDNAKQFTFESIGQPSPMVAPIGADVMIAKEKEKKNILSNSNELSKYSKSRIDALTGDIQNLKKQLSAHTLPSSTQMGIPSLTPTQFYTDGADSIKDEIAAKQKYLQQFKDNLLKLASHQVVKERNIPNPSQQDIESIGADVLQVTHDAGIGDDLEVLRTIGEVAAPRKVPSNVSLGVPTPSPTNYTASAIPKSDIDLTTQNIKYKFYKTGAEALQQYYINQAEEFGDKAKDNIAALNEINQKLSKPMPANDRDALVAAQQAIMQDSDVKEYLNSLDNAIVYSKKSKDAVDNFPQVKRQQMQQTLNDVYFNMLLAKDAATSAIPNNFGLRVANWLFGDTAGEEDVKSLSKATGISEDQVRDIINQRAQGWFSGSDKSGVRVPGFLPAIAQGMDETMGNAAMGIDRFFGAKNAEASNRILSDKLQSYNLRAQKAKLYDDAGKLNFNPYSLMNEMGRGIGQTAIYAAPSMVGGGLATGVAEGLGATVKNAENVGKVISGLLTVDSGFAASYEDAYKEAARYTNDESVRRAYAFKVGLANGLSETILEPAAVAKKVGLGKNTTKETFNTFLKNYKEGGAGKAVWEGLKEAGGVIRDENIEELLVNIAQNKAKESDLGVDTSPSEFMDQSIQTIISTTLTTLPLGIGAGMNGARDQSGIRRNALFEAGNNPELYTGELKKKLDNGSLNQDQYNERVSVVNTMAAIVKNIKPTDIHGNKLSYDQKSKLAAQQFRILNNNRILESGATVEAEKPIIEADNKEAIKNQSDILNATPTESFTEESIQEFDEGVPQSSKDALIEKIQAIDSRNAMVKQAQQNPEEGIAFIQDQATGMTSDRRSAAQPTYDETVKMFGEDVVNHAVSVLPQDTKDMILRSWKDKGIEAPAPLINALQSTGGEMQEQAKSEVATEEKEEESPKVTIAEIIDKPVTYNGKKATIVQDGQTLVAKINGENVEYELGNIDEIKGDDISDYGIESEQSVVSTNDDGDIVVRGNAYKNNYSNPLAAINYDKDGNVQSVTLDTENGQKRTFRGDIAEDIAYQIQLKEISKDNESRQQFEDFVEQDDETKQQIVSGYDEAVAAQGAEGDNEKVPAEPNKGTGTQQSEPETKPVERKKAEKRESPTKKESSLTKDAEDLLSSLGDGSAPAFVSKNLERIAKENGIEVTDKTTANDIINQLREKQEEKTPEQKKQTPPKSTVNSEGYPTKNPSAAVEIPDRKSPKEAAKAYRDSAKRLREQGDIDGAEKLEKYADELERGTTKKSSPKNKITTIEEAEEELKRLFALDSLTKNNEEGEVSLINKNGEINYEQLKRTSDGIEAGKIVSERFSPQEQRGFTDGGRANVEASVILATKSRSDKSFANSNEAQENAIEEYAKNDLSNNIASDKISSIKVGDKENSVHQYLEKARAVLSQLYPNATITTYDTAEEYYDKEKRPVGSAGVFHPKEQRLALNLELISKHGIENTVFHEVIHPIVNEAIVSREGALDSAWARLKELKDVPGMEAVFDHIQAYAGRGTTIQKVEGITEFLTQVADGRIDISKMPEKTSSKIIDLINKIFEALGISKRIGTPTDLKRLADAIKSSFESADASAIKEVIGRRESAIGENSFDSINGTTSERADIEKRAKEDGTWMKAPNGKASNLSEDQWVAVRTTAFKKWFGDWENNPDDASKVVDENGEPLVVYHGSKTSFNEFKVGYKKGSADKGLYFSGRKSTAESYRDPYEPSSVTREFFLNIRKPYIHDQKMVGYVSDLEKSEREKRGYDGERGDGWKGVPFLEIVAYYPNQIKSATENSGSFSDKSDNIFDSINQKEQEDAIKDIIARSENIDEEKLKDLIKKYTGWDDEKVNGFFTPKQTGITHAQTKETAKEFGFKEYEKDIPQTIDEWDREAEKKIKEGYDINGLISKIESGHLPTNVEQRIMGIYISGLEAEIEKNPSDENIEKLIRAVKASDIGGGREVARSLVSRKGSRPRDNSLAAFFVEQSEANDGAPLTEQQRKDTEKEYNEIRAAQKALEEKILKLQQENAKLQAEQEVSRQKRSSGKSKKSHADYVTERNDILKNIKDKLKAARTGESGLTAVPIPYAKELFAIAPDVMKLTKSLVEEGITKLSDIVKDIHANLKDSIADITENDIHDIIAGRYNEPKPTKSQLSTQLQDLRTEAKLINEIEAALRGEPKTERQKRHKNQRIEELRKRLREIYRSQGKSYDEKVLDATKKRIQKSIDELQAKLNSGDFSIPTKKEPIKLDKEAIALKDKLRELQHERAIRLMQEKYENRSTRKKALDRALEIANIPRTIMSSLDYSAPLRQAVIPTVSHPIMAAKAAVEMFKQSFSQKRFDRWFADLREDPRYDLMQKSGLYIADPHDPRLAAKEEAFMNNLVERIPILGGELHLKNPVNIPGTNKKIQSIGGFVKGSERAYVGYLNKMRVDLFNRMVDAFENDGFTYENSPELYNGLSSWINNSTGRGNLGAIESAAPVLNSAFFSPRLIASRFNILGLSDIALAGKGLYGKMPQRMRVEALKDLIKFFGAGSILLSVLAYAFGGPDKDRDLQIELDPRSSDFGKIKSGNTRWDIWGGFQQYVRILAQLISGQKKSASTERVSELSGKGSFGETRGDVAQRFFRGKLSPVFSMGADILTGRTISGEKVTVPEEIKSHFAPLLFSDVKEAMKDNGIQSLFSVGIPSVFGVGVQTYNPRGYENVNRKEGIYKTLFDKDLNLSLPEQKEMTDKQYDKFLPVREKIFKYEWDNVIKYGAMLNEDGSPTLDENKSYGIKPFDKLTHDELTSIMKSISSRSTRLAEKEIGYEKPKDKKNKEFIK